MRAVIGGAENTPGEAVDHRLADVGPGTRRVDAAGVCRLQDEIGGADLLCRVQAAWIHDIFHGRYVEACSASSGGAITQIQRREAGVVGGVLQDVRRAQRLVHQVHQMSVVGHVFHTVAVGHSDSGTPDAGLRVAAHTPGAEQAAHVADASLNGGSARAILQPGVDLRNLVVHGGSDGEAGVGKGPGLADAEFHFVAGRIGLHLQEIDAAGLEGTGDLGAVTFGLLVDTLIGVGPVAILFAVLFVAEELGDDEGVGDQQIGGQHAGCSAFVFEAKPVEAGGADLAVVEVFDVVSPAGDVEGVAVSQRDGLGLRDGVVGLHFDDGAAVRDAEVDRMNIHPQGHVGVVPWGLGGEGFDFLDGARFTPAREVKDGGFVFDGGDFEFGWPRFWGFVDDVEVGIEGVEDFAEPGELDGNSTIGRQL